MVDDEEDVCIHTNLLLKRMGITAQWVKFGRKAVQMVRESGHLCAKTIPILAMTANAFKEDVDDAYAAGMNGHIAKPIDVEKLLQTITELF